MTIEKNSNPLKKEGEKQQIEILKKLYESLLFLIEEIPSFF